MNRFALLSLYRSLTRHRLYSVLNIGGLAVGIAVFLVLGLYVRFETSFERWLPNHQQIYLVQTDWIGIDSPFVGTWPNTMGGLIEQMKGDYPGLVGTRIEGGEGGGSVTHGGIATLEDIAQVDADFFKIFDLPMVSGDKARALADPSAAVLSQSIAHKYFGDVDPIGQTLTITIDKPMTYRVTGVFKDLPKNTDLRFGILTRIPVVNPEDWWFHWGSTSVTTFLRFPTPAAAKAFEQKLPGFVDHHGFKDLGAHASRKIALPLLPFTQEHLKPAGQASASLELTVVTLGLVGLLTLLIAIVNYVNLTTARAGLRAREVAMRKVLGADRGTLLRQFMGEAVLTAALATLVGLIIAELSLPFVNAAGGLSLSIPYAQALPALVGLALVIGALAGIYPALLLARFPAAQVLASARAPGGGRAGTRTREMLVVLQFSLAIAFIVGTLVVVAQMRHVRSTDLGFRREGLLVVSSLNYGDLDTGRQTALIDAFRQLPGVIAVATADSSAGGFGNNNMNNVDIDGKPKPGPSLRKIVIGSDFFRVYRPRLLAGRLFDDAHRMDDANTPKTSEPRNIVINRTAALKLGFPSPQQAVGKTVWSSGTRTIIGVVDDLRFFSPRLPSDPTYYVAYRGLAPYPVATLRFSGDPRSILAAVRAVWLRMAPQAPLIANTGEHELAKFYEDDDHAAHLFAIGAGLAVLIGCVGLWGLASFNTQRRVKEIGIRKTLGASSADIVRLLVGQFLRPVLIANLIAWPLAFFAMRTWLAGFDDRIALSPLFFIGASVLAIGIAVLTVLGQSLRASRATPAWAMRHE
ncbi:ABC transporter permease [Sphingomonas abietis]|uniref:ABC transporter permease n=1 Tax=Sphingomonas abietis TaxID=3012344 RepID=A0ABY7NP15_9SPHN|nr:ABC transporter permease [Sphingomonas abietis]WBO22327.1 ABC transporter permease [Sphingomonas abietis]